MERVNQSKVWKHFTRDYNDDKAKCIHCSQNISCKGGSTSGLFRHLKSKHNLNSSESKDQPCSKKVKVQQKSILLFVRKKVCKVLSLNWQLWMVFLYILLAKVSLFVSHLVPKAYVFHLGTLIL